jgi:hypothetical protein
LQVASGGPGDPTRRLSEVVQNAILFEELGFDGFAVGERHHVRVLSSSPPVVLSHIAAVTSTIRLFTGVTLLSVRGSAVDPDGPADRRGDRPAAAAAQSQDLARLARGGTAGGSSPWSPATRCSQPTG